MINKSVESEFKRVFLNGTMIRPFKEFPFLADKIKAAMQKAYDAGHNDGMSETCSLF